MLDLPEIDNIIGNFVYAYHHTSTTTAFVLCTYQNPQIKNWTFLVLENKCINFLTETLGEPRF